VTANHRASSYPVRYGFALLFPEEYFRARRGIVAVNRLAIAPTITKGGLAEVVGNSGPQPSAYRSYVVFDGEPSGKIFATATGERHQQIASAELISGACSPRSTNTALDSKNISARINSEAAQPP
jgi:hypothetical protein